MIPSLLTIIEGCRVTWDGQYLHYTGRARIDDDGTGPAHRDPDHQGQTSLQVRGHFLNADVDRYIVVPPQILRGVRQIVLGSKVTVTYRGVSIAAVVGDIGPSDRLGEISIALAIALGIDPDANTGGLDLAEVDYLIEPGVPAEGYDLQAA